MYLLLSIISSGILGFVLVMMEPLIGGVIALAIVLGCLFRGLYLLQDIHKRLSMIAPKKDRIQEVYDSYLAETDKASS